jgi:hypothetical protein
VIEVFSPELPEDMPPLLVTPKTDLNPELDYLLEEEKL